MQSTTKFGETKYVVLELLAGVILSIAYLKITLSIDDDFWGKDFFTGIIRFYIGLSVIFFCAVVVVGIIGAIRSKQSQQIASAILYSIIFWFLSSVVAAFAASILQAFALYLVLPGITFGFNYGLRRRRKVSEP
jgi:hypothetical protein